MIFNSVQLSIVEKQGKRRVEKSCNSNSKYKDNCLAI